jgi:Alpha/beta hydrolase domain
MVRRLLCSAACALLMSAGLGGVAQAQSTGPTVSGPVTGGKGVPIVFSGQPADALVGRESFDLASVGYTQEEFFLDGTASAYSPAPGTTLTADGRWTVEPTSEADYTTRVVVNRPLHRRDFNGTVVVEWLNVSGGADASPDWMHTHAELIRSGYAWVGVSAQAVGLNALKADTPQGDPVRYASLTHPGDSYSYDIYSQAGQAIRDELDQVLGGLRPRRLLAVGESQSAGRMVTYIDAYTRWRASTTASSSTAATSGAHPCPSRRWRRCRPRRPRSSATTSTTRCWSSTPRPTPAPCWPARPTAPPTGSGRSPGPRTSTSTAS